MRALLGPEGRTVTQADAMLFKISDWIGQAECLDVEPCEISCLDGCLDADAGQFVRDEVQDEIAVAAQVGEQRLAPRLAVAVSGLAGGVAEVVDLGDDAGGRTDEARP